MDQKASYRQKIRDPVAAPASDVMPANDVASTPIASKHHQGRTPVLQTPATPQECATMVQAVEEAIQHAQDVTPDSSQAVARVPLLQEWLQTSGVQLPTPAREDLHELTAAAEDNKRLRKQIEALREAELEMAAREAEETARGFAMLEEDNLSLAADNERLQRQLAELQASAQAAAAAAAAAGPSAEAIPTTPMSAHWIDGVHERATVALQRAADTRRLSGVFEEQQLASMQKLGQAEQQLSEVKAQRPGSNHSQRAAMQQRLLQAEQEVHAAAAAAEQASQQLQLVAAEKDKVQQELQAIRQQLETQPMAKQHADLYSKLVEVQQQLQEEKQQHERLTGSLLEHAGRLSHKYYNLSDDFGELQRRYRHLASTNEQLASQLKEAHEALYDLHAAVQATPPAKRQQQRQLMARVSDAEQAVMNLATEKSQLQQRLLQAQAFIACLQQRPGASTRGQQQQQQQQPLLLMATPSASAAAASSGEPTPVAGDAAAPNFTAVPVSAAAAATEAAPSTTAAADASPEEFGGFITPVKGRSNPLFDLPATPATDARAATAPAAIAHAANFALGPVSPILAAAAEALSSCAGPQQQQHIQWSAASDELQDVHHEQLGLRQEILKARSALADIAGQLRGSIGGAASAPAAAEAPAAARSTASSSSSSSAARSDGRAKSASGAAQTTAVGAGLMRTAWLGVPRNSSSSSSKSSTGSQGSASAAACSRGSKALSVPAAYASTAAASASSARSSAGAGSSTRPAVSGTGTAARQSNRQLQAPAYAAAAAAAAAGTKSIGVAGTAQRSSGNAGRQEFAFSSLDSSEQPQPLGSAAAASYAAAAAAAAAASPCESTGSIGSSNSQRKPEHVALTKAASEHYSKQQQATSTATSVSGGACSSARAAGSAAAAAASGDAGGSRVQASSGSISISLDQFIADGESVSLEYGMSPGPASGLKDTAGTTGAAAAAGVFSSPLAPARPQQVQPADAVAAAAALAQAFATAVPAMTQGSMCSGHLQQQQQQQEGSPVTPCMTAASNQEQDMCDSVTSSSIDWLLQQQQAAEQLTFERLASCLAVTPGSAQSSAAGAEDAAAAARQWMLQQQQAALAARALYGTPEGISAGVLQRSDAADMQSAVRPGAAGNAAAASAVSPLRMQLAMTPVGAERVVSNMQMSGLAGSELSPQDGSVQQQQQQRSLLTPSFATPTEIINKRAMVALGMPWSPATEDTATSAARQQEDDEMLVLEAAAAALDTVQATPAVGADLQAAQQWLLQTPHAAPGSNYAAAAAAEPITAASSSCSAASWAAALAAQPAADSPAAQIATPAASLTASAAVDGSQPSPLQLAASALLASISPAGLISPGEVLPAAAVRHMTPEWMRDLKRRCAATSLDVAALRAELGLVTPEAAATSKAGGLISESGKTPGQQILQQDVGAPAGSVTEGDVGLQQSAATGQSRAGRWPAATPNVAAATAAASEGTAASAHAASAASARSNIDKLRRRAIAQSAAAAAASAAPCKTEVAASEACSMSMGTSAADLEAAFAELTAAAAAADDAKLDRCDSSGSLAQYMVQQQEQTALQQALIGDVSSRSSSRSSSIQGYKAMPRPDCPTPGSAYSVAGDADDVGRGSASPDAGLLAGLSSSRLMARHLQQQLQRHLDRSASLPALQPMGKDQPVHEGSVEGSAEGPAEGPEEEERASEHSSVSMEGNAAAALAAAAADAVAVTFPDAVNLPEITPQKGPAQNGQQQQQAAAAASPFTPGAMLNAGAESRLLSPSTDLQHVFDDAPGGSTLLQTQAAVAAAAAADDAGESADVAAAVQALQDCSEAEEEADSSSNEAAPASAAVAQAACSLRAHQLSSLAAGTFTTTPCSIRGGSSSNSPASVAHGALQAATTSAATVKAAAPAASAEWTWLGAGILDSEACSSSSEAADPSLGSWAAAAAAGDADQPVAGASAAAGSSCVVSPAGQPVAPVVAADGTSAAAFEGSLLGAAACSSIIDTRVQPEHIRLGDSPTTLRQSATTAAAAAAAGVGEVSSGGSSGSGQLSTTRDGAALGRQISAGAGSIADTPSGYGCSSIAMQGVRLGPSPEPCSEETSDINSCTGSAALQKAAPNSAAAPATSVSAAMHAAQQQEHRPAESEVTAVMPSASAAGAVSMYATPAVAFESPGVSSAAAATAQHVYYTAMQHTARCTGTDTAAAARRHASATDGVVAFGGFDSAVEEESSVQHQDMPAGVAAAAAAAMMDAFPAEPNVAEAVEPAETHNVVLQQLLASPGGSSCGSPGAWEPTPTAAAAMQEIAASCVSRSNAEERQLAASGAAAAGASRGPELVSHAVSVTLTAAEDSMLSGIKSTAQCREGDACIGSTISNSTGQAASSSSSRTGASRRSSSAATAPSQQQQQQGNSNQRPGSAPVASMSSSSRTDLAAAAAAAATHSPARSSRPSSTASGAASAAALQQQLLSPTLSDLGFIDAPTAADYARLPDEKQQQQPAPAADGDLAGMTFEQRLALLCDVDSDGEQQHANTHADLDAGSCAGSAAGDAEQAGGAGQDEGQDEGQELGKELASSCGQLTAAADVDLPTGTGSVPAAVQEAQQASSSSSSSRSAERPMEVAAAAEQRQQQQEVCHTPSLPTHLASRATQTSPALADAASQRACDAQDMSTQVTTPALQKQHSTASAGKAGIGSGSVVGRAAAAAGDAAERSMKRVQQQGCQAGGGTCDVTASPVKAKDQV